jgi:hypothetical protein
MCVRGFLWRGPVGGCACPDLDTAAEFDDPCGEACRMDFAGYGGVAIGSSILEVERLVFRASISVVFSISSLLGVSIIAHQTGKMKTHAKYLTLLLDSTKEKHKPQEST